MIRPTTGFESMKKVNSNFSKDFDRIDFGFSHFSAPKEHQIL